MKTEIKSYIFDDVRLKPSEQIGLHFQSEWELTLLIKGSGKRTIGEITEPITQGEVILIPPGLSHNWTFDTEDFVENITVLFSTHLLESISATFPEMGEQMQRIVNLKDAITFNYEDTLSISKILIKMRGKTPEYRLPYFISLLLIMASSGKTRRVGYSETKSPTEIKCDKIRIFCTTNMSKGNLTLNMVANHVGMNKTSLCKFMQRHFKMTFSQYLNEMRLNKSIQILTKSELSISEVAYDVGYSSVPYFIRVFNRRFGCTPKQYRKKLNDA